MKKIFFNKTGLFGLLFGAVAVTTSCKKELPAAQADPTPEAYVAVHNFALLAGTTSSVFVNGSQLSLGGSSVALGVGASILGNYIGVTPGSNTIGVRTSTGTANYASRTVDLARNSFSSFFAFDTLTTAGAARMLVLSNDMRAAASGTSNIRFLHLSPNAGTLSVTLVRTLDQFGLAASGTINLGSVPYIGASATPNEATLSAFTNIPAGTYTLTGLSGTTAVFTIPGLVLRETKNYSIVARGFTTARPSIPTGQTLSSSTILHNP
jgi:hypothetical protein